MRLSSLLKNMAYRNPQRNGVRRNRKWQTGSAETLEVRQLLVATVTQMGDLNLVAETGASDPAELTQVGNTLFFTAMDKTHGRELWKKEGTSAVELVKDIFVGTESSSISELTAVGSTLFFSAYNGINGQELWKSDGTAAGTVLVRDYTGSTTDTTTFPYGSNPKLLTSAGGKLFYVAHVINENISGIVDSLVVSDGTAAGTGIVSSSIGDVWTGSGAQLTAVGSEVYFRAWSPGNIAGTELWKSDGTTAGTVQISDIWPGGGLSHVENITPVGSTTYFTAWYSNGLNGSHNRELWKTNGTAAGTVLVKDINTGSADASSDPIYLTSMNGTLYFSADDGINGRELWKSNGTSAGTLMVSNIVAGVGSSNPGNLTAVGNTLFFYASDGVTGDELWKSDGTSVGTVRVGHSGTSANFTPRNLTNIGSSLYFSAFTFENGTELWKSDGTTAGTNVYRDINPGASPSNVAQLTAINGVLYYTANDGVKGNELWQHDLTTNMAVINDIFRGTFNSSPRAFLQAGSNVFFLADNGIHGEELWKCTASGTGAVMVKDIRTGAGGSQISGMIYINGTLYFSALTDENGAELWKSDGTAAGTVMVKEIAPGTAVAQPSALTNLNGTLLFAASDTNGHELWKSDGTAAGTVMVKNIAAGAAASMSPYTNTFVKIGSTVYFAANDGIDGAELWKTDGTAAGTVLVKDIWTAGNGASPESLTDVNGRLYFTADDGISGRELWQSDGTAIGTILVLDRNAGGGGSVLRNLVNADGKLFFEANGSGGGLWDLMCRATPISDTVLLRSLIFGVGGGARPAPPLTAIGGTVYFANVDDRLGEELWKSDGTPAGTVMVKDIVPIMTANPTGWFWGSNPLNLVNNNGTLFFTANDMVSGQEIWISDGTADGTKLLADLTGDAGSSHPENLTAIGGRVFMSAMSEAMGREPVTVIDIVVPSIPSITAPAATTSLQRPAITWTASTNAVSYDVFIKNNATGANPQVSVNVAGTSFTPTIDLGIGSHTVWVRAVSSSGGKSAWSALRNFTVNTSAVPAPMIRNQFTSRPNIVWKDLPGAVKFDVWLDSTTAGQVNTVILHNVTGKSWQSATELPLGQYRAWVRGLDASGLAANWSSLINFSVVTAPTMTGPITSTFSQRPQLTWNAVASATKYEVQVKNLDTETLVVNQTNIAATNWTPSSDLPAGNYRWWSIAANPNYRGQWSKPVDFYVGGRTELLTPTGSGNDTTPTFTWKTVTGAASYQLWVDRADTYVSAIINVSGLTANTYTANTYTPTTALPLGTYRAWVRAVSTTGEVSGWSEVLEFSIVQLSAPNASSADSGIVLATASLLPRIELNLVAPMAASIHVASRNTESDPEDQSRDRNSGPVESHSQITNLNSSTDVQDLRQRTESEFEFIDDLMAELSQPNLCIVMISDDGSES